MKKSGNKTSVAVIATVFNEMETIKSLLEALQAQTLSPGEVIIVDGGSSDLTFEYLQQFRESHPSFPLQLFQKKGNRSTGRNYAISQSKSEFIAITDAGCIPDQNWLEELLSVQAKAKVEVVAGYYRGLAKSPFEQAVIPYALVMPDRVDPQEFLPATRSMLISKSAFDELGGFDETLADNEDFAFAMKIKNSGKKISFASAAVVSWQPRSNLRSFYQMIFRFARGDVFAGIVRPKVVLIFARYLSLTAMLILFHAETWFLQAIFIGLILYSIWSISKNFKYVPKGVHWLPVLQIVSDIAVMHGSVAGFLKKI